MRKVKDLKVGDKCWYLHSNDTVEIMTLKYIDKGYLGIHTLRFEGDLIGASRHTLERVMVGEATIHNSKSGMLFLNREDLFRKVDEIIKKWRIIKIEALKVV